MILIVIKILYRIIKETVFDFLERYHPIFGRKARKYEGKKILIIGGTAGLGLALAEKLSKYNSVTVSGRKYFDTQQYRFNYIKMDVTKEIEFGYEYDVIFFCAGFAKCKYFADYTEDELRVGFEVNYWGPIKALQKTISNQQVFRHGNKVIDFVLIGTPLSFFPLPGYGAYAPTKSALYNLFSTIKDELLAKNKINLFFYILSTTQTPGYDQENLTKPEETYYIEKLTVAELPERRAETLLKGMLRSNLIYSDYFVAIIREGFTSWPIRLINRILIKLYYKF